MVQQNAFRPTILRFSSERGRSRARRANLGVRMAKRQNARKPGQNALNCAGRTMPYACLLGRSIADRLQVVPAQTARMPVNHGRFDEPNAAG
jgi:hypothetical protein